MGMKETVIRHAYCAGWFVDTQCGSMGPFDTEQEARELVTLLAIADAARNEFGCAEVECTA